MSASKPRVRLRQAVLVAAELEPSASRLRSALDLGEPFRDPGVGEFGLANVVFALGDCFLEVISPTQPGTAAGRYLERHGGDGGYMAIFDLEDLDGRARARPSAGRARRVADRSAGHLRYPSASGRHARRDRLDRPLPPVRRLALGRPGMDRATARPCEGAWRGSRLRWPIPSAVSPRAGARCSAWRSAAERPRERCRARRRRGRLHRPAE